MRRTVRYRKQKTKTPIRPIIVLFLIFGIIGSITSGCDKDTNNNKIILTTASPTNKTINTTENNTTITIKPTATTKPTTTVRPTTTVKPTATQKIETKVYVSSNKVYHSKYNCSGMKQYTIMTLTEAQNRRYKRCGKCW